MIVDCHTRIWDSPQQLGIAPFHGRAPRGPASTGPYNKGMVPDASFDEHHLAGEPVDRILILGFKSRYLSAEIPNAHIARFVQQHPDKLIGVAGIDPTTLPDALVDIRDAKETHGLRGITISPSAQDFHPADSRAMQVFAEAARLRMPVIIDQGIEFSAASKMEFARPSLLDEVARELPQLKILIAHMGYPWTEECIVLLGKHPNVFADVSGLLQRPWQAYNALLSAFQYGVIEKLVFGSNFPFASATTMIEALYRINQLVTGTNMPTVPRQFLAGIVERDALGMLGIEPAIAESAQRNPTLLDEHDG